MEAPGPSPYLLAVLLLLDGLVVGVPLLVGGPHPVPRLVTVQPARGTWGEPGVKEG